VSESELVNLIFKYYYKSNVFIWRSNSGTFKAGRRYIKCNIPGVGDLTGFMGPDGRFVTIECKTGANSQLDTQIDFERECEARNTIYILARSLQDVIDIIGEPIRPEEEITPEIKSGQQKLI